ncbi:MAG: hypothetical protein H6744_12860 [Deltaproteobacteria bacterium]|nr:hypothetical protein [Deltaproteobacteria bacterium]MCB9787564.1 hypothetical protein [Deltaproteobacteria bacterium]
MLACALVWVAGCGTSGGSAPADGGDGAGDAADVEADGLGLDVAGPDADALQDLDAEVEPDLPGDVGPTDGDGELGGDDGEDGDAELVPGDLLEDRQGFHAVARVPLSPSGVSEPLPIAVDAGSGAAFLRVSARDAVARCFQLDEVLTGEGVSWISDASISSDYGAVCHQCLQRASVGQGFGVFQLPNDGSGALGTSTLEVRVSERDCATSLPLSLAPDAATPAETVDVELREVEPRPAAGEPLVLPVRVVVSSASQFDADAAEMDPVLSEAFELVRAAFAPQGIAVDFVAVVTASVAPADPLVYGSDDVSALRAALDAALGPPSDSLDGLAPLTVFVAGCLRRRDPTTGVLRDPQAVTTHVPAGLGPPGVGDGVVLAGHACPLVPAGGYWGGATLGTILAHELGHALGLYHVAEASGFEDNLPDTGPDNLMNADPLGHLNDGFSASQGHVMRSHPLLRPPP